MVAGVAGIAVDTVAVVGPRVVDSVVAADGESVGAGSACSAAGEGTVSGRPAGTAG